MKHVYMTFAAGLAMLLGGHAFAQNPDMPAAPILYGGVGPVIAGGVDVNQLPKDARDFIHKYFRDYTVAQCEKEFDDNTYEVEFSDGTDLEFDARGRWLEVDAGRRRILPAHVVKSILPDRAHKELEKRGVSGQVESVKRYADGYKVEIKNAKYDDYRFAHDGKLLSIAD